MAIFWHSEQVRMYFENKFYSGVNDNTPYNYYSNLPEHIKPLTRESFDVFMQALREGFEPENYHSHLKQLAMGNPVPPSLIGEE
jgi:hypothetical protein